MDRAIYQKVGFIQKYGCANLSESVFYTKRWLCHLSLQWHFPLFMSSQVPKISQKWPCTVPVIAEHPDQGVVIPNQNLAKLSVLPCFARIRFCSPVFCPFLPIFCPKMGKKWAKTGKFAFVCFCLNSPEFARFRSSCACAVRHPLTQMSYKGSQCAIVEINGKGIFSYKVHFLINLHTVALYVVEVKKNWFVMLVQCCNSAEPSQNIYMPFRRKKRLESIKQIQNTKCGAKPHMLDPGLTIVITTCAQAETPSIAPMGKILAINC